MMFAVGPDELNLNSNAKDAGLRRVSHLPELFLSENANADSDVSSARFLWKIRPGSESSLWGSRFIPPSRPVRSEGDGS